MGLVGAYNGTVRVIDGLVQAGCCCCIPGNEPTAAFSYEQTGQNPCVIDLTDESTVHANCEDGAIVSWKWYKNAETTPFSTDQNPTGVEVEDGDDIRLWVKDSCGCTDEVMMGITCEDFPDCGDCPDEPLPLLTSATISGYVNSFPGTCANCDHLNATHELTWTGIGCEWKKEMPPPTIAGCLAPSGAGTQTIVLTLTVNATHITFSILFTRQTGTLTNTFKATRTALSPCNGTWVLEDFTSSSTGSGVGGPCVATVPIPTVTVTI